VVYVVKEDGTVEMRTVTLGLRDGDGVVVEKGVKAGEQVIVDGMMKAKPGAPVKLAQEKPAAAEGKAE